MGIYADAMRAAHRVGTHGGDYTHDEKRKITQLIRVAAATTGAAAAATSDTAVQAWKTSHDTLVTDATAAAGVSTALDAVSVTQWGLIDAEVALGVGAYATLVVALDVAKAALLVPLTTLDTAVQLVNTDGVASAILAATAATASTAALAAVPAGESLPLNPVMEGP